MSRVPAIVRANRTWIERAQRRFENEGDWTRPIQLLERPEQLCLRLVGEELSVRYEPSRAASVARASSGILRVSAPLGDEDAERRAMKRYLARRARRELKPRLRSMADDLEIEVESVSIRGQIQGGGAVHRRAGSA